MGGEGSPAQPAGIALSGRAETRGVRGSRYPVTGREVRVPARHPFILLVPTAPQAHFILFLITPHGL